MRIPCTCSVTCLKWSWLLGFPSQTCIGLSPSQFLSRIWPHCVSIVALVQTLYLSWFYWKFHFEVFLLHCCCNSAYFCFRFINRAPLTTYHRWGICGEPCGLNATSDSVAEGHRLLKVNNNGKTLTVMNMMLSMETNFEWINKSEFICFL